MSELPIIDLKNTNYNKVISTSGTNYEKNHPVNKCVTELDLLDSVIGISFKYLGDYKKIHKSLVKIQSRLIYLRCELLTHPRDWDEFCKKSKCINQKDIDYIDKCCNSISKSIKDIEDLGGNYGSSGESSAFFDYIECVCKKFEIALHDLDDNIHSTKISHYISEFINKLGQYLYLIARYLRD